MASLCCAPASMASHRVLVVACHGSYTIDYALNRVTDAADVMGTQHRISVMIDFGKTKTERVELSRRLEIQRIEEQTAQRVTLRQKLDFEDFMNKGKAYYQQGEFSFR